MAQDDRYERHPIAIEFGPAEVDEKSPEFAELRDDIQENGLNHPIYFFEGRVLLGWTRYRCLLAAGLEFDVSDKKLFRAFTGTAAQARKLLISDDYKRRHMSHTERQKAALRLANVAHGGDRRSDQGVRVHHETVSQEEAAKLVGISVSAVKHASATMKKVQASPVRAEIETALANGKTSFKRIDDLIALPEEEQRAEVKKPGWVYGTRKPVAPEHRHGRRRDHGGGRGHVLEKVRKLLAPLNQEGRYSVLDAVFRLDLDVAHQVLFGAEVVMPIVAEHEAREEA
jgi:hypothetical protein